jgi:hypothetical protein
MTEGQREASGDSPPESVTTGRPIGVESGPLDEEIDFYLRHLEEWEQDEGRHVLIRGNQQFGFYPTRDEALKEGLRLFGRTSFMVKQVVRDQRPRWMGAVIF